MLILANLAPAAGVPGEKNKSIRHLCKRTGFVAGVSGVLTSCCILLFLHLILARVGIISYFLPDEISSCQSEYSDLHRPTVPCARTADSECIVTLFPPLRMREPSLEDLTGHVRREGVKKSSLMHSGS